MRFGENHKLNWSKLFVVKSAKKKRRIRIASEIHREII
jgi:hypothetical protein